MNQINSKRKGEAGFHLTASPFVNIDNTDQPR